MLLWLIEWGRLWDGARWGDGDLLIRGMCGRGTLTRSAINVGVGVETVQVKMRCEMKQ